MLFGLENHLGGTAHRLRGKGEGDDARSPIFTPPSLSGFDYDVHECGTRPGQASHGVEQGLVDLMRRAHGAEQLPDQPSVVDRGIWPQAIASARRSQSGMAYWA